MKKFAVFLCYTSCRRHRRDFLTDTAAAVVFIPFPTASENRAIIHTTSSAFRFSCIYVRIFYFFIIFLLLLLLLLCVYTSCGYKFRRLLNIFYFFTNLTRRYCLRAFLRTYACVFTSSETGRGIFFFHVQHIGFPIYCYTFLVFINNYSTRNPTIGGF